jgi:hypothetical protein
VLSEDFSTRLLKHKAKGVITRTNPPALIGKGNLITMLLLRETHELSDVEEKNLHILAYLKPLDHSQRDVHVLMMRSTANATTTSDQHCLASSGRMTTYFRLQEF